MRIRRFLEEEDGLRRFLYVVPEPQLAAFILEYFAGTKAELYCRLGCRFSGSFKEMNVAEAASGLISQ